MARRKDHSPQQLRQLTIEAVISFLGQQPVNQLSLRSLAKIIGYSPGTLINLFANYNHLLLEVSGFTLEQIKNQLSTELAQAKCISPQNSILTIATGYLKFAQQTPYQWLQVFEHKLADDQEIPATHQQKINALFEVIEPLMAELAPTATSDQIIIASRTLWASVHGICVISVENKLFTPQNITSEMLIESLVLHYLNDWAKKNQGKEI